MTGLGPRPGNWCRRVIISLALAGAALDGRAESEQADKLEQKPNAAESEKRKLSERILQSTTGVRDKLAGKDLSPMTQRQQQEVVDDLQTLIDLLKKSPPPPQQNNSNSNSDSNSDSSSDSQDQSQNSRSNKSQSKNSQNSKLQGTGSEQNRQQPQDSEERQGESRESKQQADRKLHLENDIWGHLPPNLREEMLNFYGERMLPQYENLVRKFYETLSEPNRTKKRAP